MNQHRLICCILLISFASQLVADAEETKGPVKVFILAGQSNMEGKALACTLESVIAGADKRDRFKHMKNDGTWTVRKNHRAC